MRPTPDKMSAFIAQFRKKMNFKSLVITLAAIVVFTTTYLLILPAFTLDKEEAAEQGGIDVAVEQTVDEQAPAEQAEEPAAEQKESADAVTKAEEPAAKGEVKEETASPEQKDSDVKEEKKEEVKLLSKKKELTADKEKTDDFTISAVVDKDAKVPEDVFLQATELTKDTEDFDYDKYYKDALKALKNDSGNVKGIKTIKFYDISLEAESQDESVEPKAAVNVKIAYEDGLKVKDADNIRIVHFAEQKDGEVKAEVLDSKENKVETTVNKKSEMTEASFDTEGFSVFAVAEMETLTESFVTDDSREYEVKVSYGADAEIPEGSRLEVKEYSALSSEYKEAKSKVEEFKAEQAENENDADAVKEVEDEKEEDVAEEADKPESGFDALDISIVDPDGNKVEPKGDVTVSINMKSLPNGFAAADLEKTLEVHHLVESGDNVKVEQVAGAEEDGSKVTADDNGASVEFTTNSFSTFTVTWNIWDGWWQQHNVTLHFVDENGNDVTGIKYGDQPVEGTSFSIPYDQLIPNDNTTLDLSEAFTVEGKTLSNTHIGSYKNLADNNDRQIVGNELRRENGGGYQNRLRYKKYKEGGDDVKWDWTDIPSGTDLYLVYSDVPSAGGGSTPDDPEAPDFSDIENSKTIKSNDNGTYTLNLSVTGQAAALSESNRVNIAIVLDTSSSMVNQGDGKRLEQAKRALVGTTADEIQASVAHKLLANNTEEYPNRVELAFINFDYKAYEHTFGTPASDWTSDENEFRNEVNSVGTHSGTNWEDAMKAVGALSSDGDPTYVIFLTDGQPSRYWDDENPSVYVDGEGCMNAAKDEARALIRDKGMELYGIFGWGTDDNFKRDLLGQLIDYAYNEPGISGDPDNPGSNDHRYNASNADKVTEVLDGILDIINMKFGFADVTINDGLTALTSTEVALDTVDEDSFSYKVTYKDAEDNLNYTVDIHKNDDGTITIPPVSYYIKDPDHPGQTKLITTEEVTVTGASYNTSDEEGECGRVVWHIQKVGSNEPYILEEGWTYNVSFLVWPSQHAYDLVAALNNDRSIWGNDYTYVDTGETITFDEYSGQIKGGPNGPFALKTNTNAYVTYKEVTSKTTETGTEYTYTDHDPVTIPYNDDMPLTSEEMDIEKKWYNPLDSRPVEDQVELSVTMGDKEFLSHVILNKPDYKKSVFISCGLITEDDNGYDIKETGHDFTFSEVHDTNVFHWNMEADIYRPMVINGTLTLLIKQDSAQGADYEIGEGNYYKKGPEGTAAISATNVRRSRLNLRKFVTDETDGTVDPDSEFTYTVKINEAVDEEIYFSVFGTNGAQYLTPEQGVKVSNNVTPTMMTDNTGEHQYYVVKSGEEFTVNAKAGWSLMFLNLSNGTTYTINESSMPDGFEYDHKDFSATEYYYATPGDPGSRMSRPADHNMEGTGTTTSGSITQSNTEYRVDYTNVWKSKDVTLIKMKEDFETELGKAEFDISKKNIAGSFVKVGEFKSTTEDEKVGEVFKLGYGIYCLTETKAPDGYVVLTNKIYFKLTTEGIELCDQNGNALSYDNAAVIGDDLLTVKIKNTPGEELPMTGGIGTTIFYILGSILAVGCGIVLVSRRRMRSEEK